MISSDANALAAQFDAMAVGAVEMTKFRVAKWGGTLRTEIASRAPGANYPGTIKMRGPRAGGALVTVEVYTDRPDGFRKERGLHKPDSKGRNYTAPGLQRDGQQHFGPAFAVIAPQFEADMQNVVLPE